MIRHVLAIALVAAVCAQLSCKLNDYCLACEKGDGGHGDGSGSGSDGSGSGDASNCTSTGPEICDGIDNDCNGLIDDGTLPMVGSACGNNMGACAGAVYACKPTTVGDPTTDQLICNKMPVQETCNNVDDNCNGVVDDGDPGGGARCGNGTGTCVQGVEHCINGSIQCTGGIGPTTEICDGLDNDCDGTIDNGLTNMGSCGAAEPGCATPPCGQCVLGTLSCVGGTPVCMGAVNPTLETCNSKDDDCDGSTDEDFDTQTDPQNCGACGNVCGMGLTNGGNATWGCTAGGCVITSCKAGYHDNNNSAGDGCEFGPCFTSGAEVCDGVDNDCDGTIDETPAIGTAPAICASKGECAGTVATCPCKNKPDSVGCATPGGWTCKYGATVSTDSSGNIIAETKCDGLDNDCNGIIDDSQPQMAHADGTPLVPVACHDNGIGACEGFGTYVCGDQVTPPQNPNGPAVCKITSPGGTPTTETCNNKDDDCDGTTDEGPYTNMPGLEWVNIGGGHQMMKYEASKPDATATDGGSVIAGIACSQKGVLPWTNVKYQQAVAACASIGATLCSEVAWHRACSVVAPVTYPLTVNSTTPALIEAESYTSASFATFGGTTRAWVEDYTNGFTGIADLEVQPITGGNPTMTQATNGAPRLDYLINFGSTSMTYHVWVHMYSTNANQNSVYVGMTTGTPPAQPTNTATTASQQTWQWVDAGAFNVAAIGNRTVSVFMAKDGVRVNAIYIEVGTTAPPAPTAGKGNQWAFATSPNTYSATTCNDHDYNASIPQADTTLPTGSLAQCYADESPITSAADHVFDLSGNVKEWVLAHQPGENPIRGGSSSSTAVGEDCPLNFTLADDTFFFPDLGFRCCR